MKFKLISKFHSNIYLISVFLLFISAIMFRGRLGSDDLEVFNFVYNFKNFEGNILQYLGILKDGSDGIIFSDDIQKHTYYTWHHRFVWIIQTYLIFNFVEVADYFFNFNSDFIYKYFSGYILSLYSVISFFLFIKLSQKQNLNFYKSFLLSSIIFLSTGLITFFTGQYIESLVIFLIILRFYINKKYLNFIIDLILLLIKPYYFVLIFFIRAKEFRFEKNQFIKKN